MLNKNPNSHEEEDLFRLLFTGKALKARKELLKYLALTGPSSKYTIAYGLKKRERKRERGRPKQFVERPSEEKIQQESGLKWSTVCKVINDLMNANLVKTYEPLKNQITRAKELVGLSELGLFLMSCLDDEVAQKLDQIIEHYRKYDPKIIKLKELLSFVSLNSHLRSFFSTGIIFQLRNPLIKPTLSWWDSTYIFSRVIGSILDQYLYSFVSPFSSRSFQDEDTSSFWEKERGKFLELFQKMVQDDVLYDQMQRNLFYSMKLREKEAMLIRMLIENLRKSRKFPSVEDIFLFGEITDNERRFLYHYLKEPSSCPLDHECEGKGIRCKYRWPRIEGIERCPILREKLRHILIKLGYTGEIPPTKPQKDV